MAFTKITAAGIGTTETVTVDGLTVINNGSFGGNLTVAGVLTYEDVTNVDSVGLITARNGIVVGSGITLSKDGDIFATGVTTSTTFSGNFSGGTVSGTTGTFTGDVDIADKIIHTGDTDTLIRFPSADTIRFDTGGTEAARINSSQKLIIGDTNSDAQLGVYRSSYNIAEFCNTNADATGAEVALRKDSSSPADGDTLGMLKFIGDNDAGEKVNYAYIQSKSSDVSDGTEDGRLEFYTRGAGTLGERLRITSGGQVNIGNSLTQTSRLFTAENTLADGGEIAYIGNNDGSSNYGGLIISAGETDRECRLESAWGNSFMTFYTNDGSASEKFRITSTGKVLIGHTSHNSTIASGVGSQLQIEGTSYATSGISLINNQAATDPAFLTFGKSRAGSNGGTTVVQNGDRLGAIRFAGADGTDLHSYGAEIACVVNGTPGSNDMPSQLLFATTADGSASPTTRLQIQADGKFFFGNNTTTQDQNNYVFVGTKAFSAGIVQGQLAVVDDNAYNFSNNGGSIAFQAKYTSGGLFTQMAAIEGRKANNTDGHYGGVLNFSTRTHNSNMTQAMYITADQAVYMKEALYVGNEFNMQSFDAVARSKYFDAGYLNNALYFRRTSGGDGAHSVQMTIASSGVISGDFNDTSDAKLKKNVKTIADGAIEDIKKLRPVTFDWIDDTRNNNISGFIAQEVKEVLPNLVEGTEYDPTLNDEEAGTKGGIKSEGYSIHSVGVTAHLTKAVQELIAEVETLKAKVTALEG